MSDRETVQDFLAAVRVRLSESLNYADALAAQSTHDLATSPLLEAGSLEASISMLIGAGGKQVRPRLVRLGYLATSPTAVITDDVTRVAAAFELLHIFGLLQDDVMDASATRRGHPSAHERIADAATGPGAHRVGESLAILAGDLAFALAGRLVRRIPDAAADAWEATVIELVQGQRLDLIFAAEGRLDVESTARVAYAKSGAYTVQRPLEMGALLTGIRTPPAWLTTYGQAIGEAFALADDVIGIWGDPEITGKPVGDDLLERKPSTVIGLGDEMLHGELSRQLCPERPRLTPGEVRTLITRMEDAGVRDAAMNRIAACRERALTSIAHTEPAVRAEFTQFADELSNRTF